eukprot:2265760-Lingulodinium_polyedra.AAC.1
MAGQANAALAPAEPTAASALGGPTPAKPPSASVTTPAAPSLAASEWTKASAPAGATGADPSAA